ncbi:MAG: hypothetical protein LUH23_05930 [Oscillospiraceae bacterium]|nr:hypothetical protein [Oscillospiraceae bacterium]
MLKKLLCVMLSALMVLSILPVGAFAAVNNITNLYVGGTDILTQTDYKIEYGTDSYAQFDSTTNTLTLHNANISIAKGGTRYAGICASTGSVSKGLTIKLEGNNTITTNANNYTSYYGIYVGTGTCKLTITSDGDGTLAIDKVNYGIYLGNTSATTISNCTVAMDNVILNGLYVQSTLAITGVNLDINYTASNTTAKGIYSYKGAATTITNSVVNINCTAGYGFYSQKKTNSTLLTVDNSSLTCTVGGDRPAILTTSVNVIGNSTVIADGGVDFCAANSAYSSYSYLTLTPSDEALGILVGSSADKNSVYGTYEETATLSQPSKIEYTNYAYLKITTDVSGSGSDSGNGTSGIRFIYVNEDYHAIIMTRNGRRNFIAIPHDVDSDGYCTLCGMYIGGEEEPGTVTLGDTEYNVLYSNTTSLKCGNWEQVNLDSDTSLMDALAEDGAILVVTRDTETVVSYADGGYEKLLFIDSWWSNNSTPMALGTAGHTSADESDVIDCTSDDGITIIYDGATIYQAWVDGGYADGGNAIVFISNTSASYNIVSIQVLVPVD